MRRSTGAHDISAHADIKENNAKKVIEWRNILKENHTKDNDNNNTMQEMRTQLNF